MRKVESTFTFIAVPVTSNKAPFYYISENMLAGQDYSDQQMKQSENSITHIHTHRIYI